MDDLTQWKAKRLAALTAPDGWLNLTDRVEIPPGPQRVGHAADNDLVLSVGPDHLGVLEVTASGANFAQPGQTPVAFAPAPGGFPQLAVGSLLLELHTVDGTPALRVRDLTTPREVELHYFAQAPEWVIRARWERLERPEAATIGQRGAADTEVTLTHVARCASTARSSGARRVATRRSSPGESTSTLPTPTISPSRWTPSASRASPTSTSTPAAGTAS